MPNPIFSNRLVGEKSPYLLQHAHNPVDWYPWGEEAFQLAQRENRPIFLSIGYATCHWCHKMEQESFGNVELARLMNETFVNIKVDREEKPEVDSLYMEFAQAMLAGEVGWPLNLFLTSDLMPFFAITYLPADVKGGALGLKQLVSRIQQIWQSPEERERVVMQAGKIVDIFSAHVEEEGETLPEKEKIREAAELIFRTADPVYGGMKGAPKFPQALQASFLLRLVKDIQDSRALFYVERTLEMMYLGGIYDHLGGGFSRYATDESWLVPHFEKMLYDNALLGRAYLEAWQYTHYPFYREVVEAILSYVARVLTDPQGGFYAAEDSDSEGCEGKFYTWQWEEIESLLGEEASLFCEIYGVIPEGNFEGRNILYLRAPLKECAESFHLDPVELKQKLQELCQTLFQAREKRVHPLKDDKIITSWNGLMITTYAEAGRAFHQPRYLAYAEKAARFIRTHLWGEEGLLRRWREGEARFGACLDDYAFFIQALLTLFEADRGSDWLECALSLTHELETYFQAENGAFYLTNGQDPHLLLRRTEFYDGAEPSGNAVHAENLLRLYQITGVESYLHACEAILRAAREHIALYPPGACYHLMVLHRYYDQRAPTLIIALNEEESHKEEIAQMLAGRFLPHLSVIWRREGDEELRDLVPSTRHTKPLQGKTTLYLCYRDRCETPITDLAKMWELLAPK